MPEEYFVISQFIHHNMIGENGSLEPHINTQSEKHPLAPSFPNPPIGPKWLKASFELSGSQGLYGVWLSPDGRGEIGSPSPGPVL